MMSKQKNIYLKPEIYIEEFDDADEGFMAGSDTAVTGPDTETGTGEWKEEEAKKSNFTPFELNWDDDNE